MQQIKSYVEIGASYLPIPYCWIAATYFSIPAKNYAVFFNNGYQKTEENATLYSKDIYYKEGNKYYIGYNVSLLKDSFSILSYYRDSSSAPHQVTKSSNHSFSSPNYNSSTSTLVKLAKKYYNKGWKSEAISYSSQIRLN